MTTKEIQHALRTIHRDLEPRWLAFVAVFAVGDLYKM